MATAIHKGQNVDIFWVITVIMKRGRNEDQIAMLIKRAKGYLKFPANVEVP